MTTAIERINPQQAHEHVQADANTMLVCAYDSQEKFAQNHLEGAISLEEFVSRAGYGMVEV